MMFNFLKKKNIGGGRVSRGPLPSRSRVRSYSRPRMRRLTPKNPLISVRTPKLVVSGLRLSLARFTYRLLFILLIFGTFYSLFFSEWLQVHSITIEGNQIVDKKAILDSVEPFLHKKVFKFFPSNNFFFVPTKQIEKEILMNFKRISRASVERIFPGGVKIIVQEKKAVLIFCNNKGCTWVDGDGVSYNQSSFFEVSSDNGNLVVVRDSSNADIPLDSLITSPEYVNFANEVSRKFKEKTGFEITEISTPIPSALELRVKTSDDWMAYFDISLSLERSLELLMKIIDQEIKSKNMEVRCLEYVDLRLSDRAFYKIKQDCIKTEGDNQNQQEELDVETDLKPSNPSEPPPVENDKEEKDKKKKKT